MKNIIVGLAVLVALAIGAGILYIAGAMILGVLALIGGLIMTVGPIVLGIAGVVAVVGTIAYAIGKAIRGGN